MKKTVSFLALFISLLGDVFAAPEMKSPFKKDRSGGQEGQASYDLHNYSLTEITIKGVVYGKEKKWLVVSDPLNRIYHLEKNSRIGKELAVIFKITLDDVFLKLPVSNEALMKEMAMKAELVHVRNHENIFVLPISQ